MITRLRGLASEIADVIGEDCALYLFQKRGGSDLKIPDTARGSKLADLVGVEAAEALIRHFGGGYRLTLPCAHLRGSQGRRARGIAMLARGASTLEVAMTCDVTTRTVENWRSSLRQQGAIDAGGQLRLL